MAKQNTPKDSPSSLDTVVANLPPRKRSTKKAEILMIAALLQDQAKSQNKVSDDLDINRQPTVSNVKVVLEVCGIAFLHRLPDDIPRTVLKNFADRCLYERETFSNIQGARTPALDLLKGTGALTRHEIKKCLTAVQESRWWTRYTLLTLAQDPDFKANHAKFAEMLADVKNHLTFSAWLANHPLTKTGIKKS